MKPYCKVWPSQSISQLVNSFVAKYVVFSSVKLGFFWCIRQYLLVSWKSTSFPLMAYFSRLIIILSCMICLRTVMSGLVMSISTSGLLIWLASPSPITSGRYLTEHDAIGKQHAIINRQHHRQTQIWVHVYIADNICTPQLLKSCRFCTIKRYYII